MADDTYIERLRQEVDLEIDILIRVATGESDIKNVNDDYKARRRRIRVGLRGYGLGHPNPWSDLWLWYGFYKDHPDLGSYQSRREHIIKLYAPLQEALEALSERQLGTGLENPETGWLHVDRQVQELRRVYAGARTQEHYRQVGLLCRDILISLGHVVFDPDRHLPRDEPLPRRDDAKRRISLMLHTDFSGSAYERARALVRALWEFVQPVVHDRTDDERKATLAAQNTINLVHTLHILIPAAPGTLPEPEAGGELDWLGERDGEQGQDGDWEPDSEDKNPGDEGDEYDSEYEFEGPAWDDK